MQPAPGGRGGTLGAEEGRQCSRRSRGGGGVFERHGAVQHGNRWRLLLSLLRRRGKDRAGPEREVGQLVVCSQFLLAKSTAPFSALGSLYLSVQCRALRSPSA